VSNNNEEESTTTPAAATIIIKPAKTEHPINDLIAKRWSARAFSTRPVDRSKLLSILEAARWLHPHVMSSLGAILYLQMIILKS
jgi:hypothetical protein